MDKEQAKNQMDEEQTQKEKSWLTIPRATVIAAIIGAISLIIVSRNGSNSAGTPPPPPKKQSDKSIEPLPRMPQGLVIFDANEWQEQIAGGTKGIVCTLQNELNVKLRKVGFGIEPATVERLLTYSKPQEYTLEIEYEFAGGTEIGVHFLIYGFIEATDKFVRLDEYEGGSLFLRVKPVDIEDEIDTDGSLGITFGLKLEQGMNTFWDGVSYSSSSVKPYKPSGWRDIRIPIKPYLDQMKKISSAEPAKLEGLVMIFGDTYGSSRHGRFRLNTIRLVKKEDEPD